MSSKTTLFTPEQPQVTRSLKRRRQKESSVELSSISPPEKKKAHRENMCVGCISIMAAWMPGDGRPMPCRDGTFSGPGAKCSRCEHHGKECDDAYFGKADVGRQLYEMIAQDPQDISAIKIHQRIARDDLSMTLRLAASDLAAFDQEDNVESECILNALQSATDSAVSLVRALDNRMDKALVKGVRHTVEAVSSLVDGVMGNSQPQFAEDAAEIIGLI